MLQTSFIHHLEHICSEIEDKPVKLRAYEKIYGGDINETYRLAMTDTDYFIKINSADKFDMFDKEAKGLQLLAESQSFVIPEVYEVGEFETKSYILMQYIPSLNEGEHPEDFAQRLVALHQSTADYFGLSFDNYIGSLPQKNTYHTQWIDFYILNRLQPQIDLAKDIIPKEMLHQFDKLYQKLPEILPLEPPALLHGDLWNGNYFYNLQGHAVVFDPAVYYGHREVDLAMMRLFGGFNPKIYELYNELFPLQPGWQKRVGIYQLYPLLVHVNLFGNSYLNGVEQILKNFA